MCDLNEKNFVTIIGILLKKGYVLNVETEEGLHDIALKGRGMSLMTRVNGCYIQQLHFYRCNHNYAVSRYEETPYQQGLWRVYESRERFGDENE